MNKFYGVKGISFFGKLERFYKTFSSKVLEKFGDSVASVHFVIATRVFDTAFLENIGEGENWAKLFVELDFGNAAHDVAFEHNVHEGIANARSVKERNFVSKKLLPVVSDFHKRRYSVEVNDGSVIAVDDFIVEMSGQNGGDVFGFVAICIFESGIDIGFINFDNSTDKFLETVKNSIAQVGSQLCGSALAGQSSVDDSGSNALITRVEIGDANAVDGVVEFVKGIVVVVAVSIRNFVDGEKVTEFLVMFLFDDSALLAVDNHAVILFLFKIVDDFAKFEVRDEAFLDGIESYIFHKNRSFTFGASSTII